MPAGRGGQGSRPEIESPGKQIKSVSAPDLGDGGFLLFLSCLATPKF